MNVGGLKKEMRRKGEEWSGMEDPSQYSDISIGRRVIRWLDMFERVTDKLENPRKLADAERALDVLRKQYEDCKALLDEATTPNRCGGVSDLDTN